MDNIEKYNDRLYKFNITLSDDKGKAVNLNGNAIENLTLEDTILCPFIFGSIVVNNTRNTLQSSINPQDIVPDFAGNNHDLLLIDIMPDVSGNIEQDSANEQLRETFNLNLAFCINELQDKDVKVSQFTNVINFRDVYHQYLLENSVNISSAEVLEQQTPGVDISVLNNSERCVPTGQLLKALLKKIYNASEDQIIDKNFDQGKTKIFWNSVGSANGLQNLLYLSKIHLSQQYEDPCILTHDRYKRKFSFESIASIFKKQQTDPQNYVLETFMIDSGLPGDEKAISSNRGLGLADAAYILDYKLSPLNGNEFTSVITNTIYSTTADADKNMFIGVKQNSIKTVVDKFKTLYVDSLKNYEPTAQASVDTDNFLTTDSLRPNISRDTKPINYEKITQNHMMFNLLGICGDNIIFRCLGSTHRRSGRFIDIETTAFLQDTSAVTDVLGRWFVVGVSHVFVDSKYYNVIEAVKTYRAQH